MKQCFICSKEFSGRGRTCSQECRVALQVKEIPKKICIFHGCEKEFQPKSAAAKFCNPKHEVNCSLCSGSRLVPSGKEGPYYCSNCAKKVASKKRVEFAKNRTEEEKAAIREKVEATNLERYGVKRPLQNKEIKEKARDTIREKYGVDHHTQLPEIVEKRKQTNLNRYGVEHAAQSDEIKKKTIETNLIRHGVKYPAQNPEIHSKMSRSFSENPKNFLDSSKRVSKINKNLGSKLFNLTGIEIKYEQPFSKYVADLKIEDYLIDINTTISHNSHIPYFCNILKCSRNCELHKRISEDYHFKRAMAAKDNNLNLIQIYDWDDQDKIIQLIAGKVDMSFKKHSAKKLTIKEITQKESTDFLEENHFQGSVKGAIKLYGLFDNKELLAVATFGKSRYSKKYEWEFLRYAIKKGHIVHGASNKLWNKFVIDNSPKSVISYVDFDHTTAPIIFLNSLGFKEVKPTGPTLMWSHLTSGKKVNVNSLLKLGADRLLGTNYGSVEESGLNNDEIMLLEGYLPVYTSGNRVFIWNQPSSI